MDRLFCGIVAIEDLGRGAERQGTEVQVNVQGTGHTRETRKNDSVEGGGQNEKLNYVLIRLWRI